MLNLGNSVMIYSLSFVGHPELLFYKNIINFVDKSKSSCEFNKIL